MATASSFTPDIRRQRAFLVDLGLQSPPTRKALTRLIYFLKRGSVLVPNLSLEQRAELYKEVSENWTQARIKRRHARTAADWGVVKYVLVRGDTERYSHTAFAQGKNEERLFDAFIQWDSGSTGRMNLSLIEKMEDT